MDYSAGLVVLGTIAILFVTYRIAESLFRLFFVFICVNAYLLLVDQVYPDVSLLRVMRTPLPCSLCQNYTLSSFETPPPSLDDSALLQFNLTDVAAKIDQQLPQGWRDWIMSKLPFFSPSSLTPAASPTSISSSSSSAAPASGIDTEMEEFRKWKAAQSKKKDNL